MDLWICSVQSKLLSHGGQNLSFRSYHILGVISEDGIYFVIKVKSISDLLLKVVPAVYTSTLFLLLLDRTRALTAASSGHRKVNSVTFIYSFIFIFQGNGGTTRIKFLLIFLWIFHITLCVPIIIGLVRRRQIMPCSKSK